MEHAVSAFLFNLRHHHIRETIAQRQAQQRAQESRAPLVVGIEESNVESSRCPYAIVPCHAHAFITAVPKDTESHLRIVVGSYLLLYYCHASVAATVVYDDALAAYTRLLSHYAAEATAHPFGILPYRHDDAHGRMVGIGHATIRSLMVCCIHVCKYG